jgi:hypothetical protein
MGNPINALISTLVLVAGVYLLFCSVQLFSDPAVRKVPSEVLKAATMAVLGLFLIGLWTVWIRKDPNNVGGGPSVYNSRYDDVNY